MIRPAWVSELDAAETTSSLEVVDPRNEAGWDAAASGFSNATVFHARGWLETLAHTYGHRPLYCVLKNEAAIQAILPLVETRSALTGLRGNSLPFSDSCPPLGTPRDILTLLKHATHLGRERSWKVIEFRGLAEEVLHGVHSLEFKTHRLDLAPDEAQLLSQCDRSTRRSIQKANQAKLTLSIETGADAMDTYFQLHCLTRQRHGQFPQPRRFFDNLHRYMIDKGQGFIGIARKNERAVAAAVFLRLGKKACYKFGASDDRHWDLRANHLVMWSSILHCRREGCTELDFGRSSAGNEGLRRFKIGFGAQEADLYYLRLDLKHLTVDRVTDRSASRMTQIIRHVPRWAARWIGAALYPHMG